MAARGASAYSGELAALRQAYARELPGKAAAVAEAAAGVAERWDRAGLERLVRLTHQLAGSAAIYGFSDVGRAAAALEDYLASARRGRARRGRRLQLAALCEALGHFCRSATAIRA